MAAYVIKLILQSLHPLYDGISDLNSYKIFTFKKPFFKYENHDMREQNGCIILPTFISAMGVFPQLYDEPLRDEIFLSDKDNTIIF